MSVIATHPAFFIPAGNWAEWLAALGTSGALIFAVVGLRNERAKDRALTQRQREAEERAQASLVAGWMHNVVLKGFGEGFPELVIRVRNGSDLPIYVVTVSADVGVRGKFYRALDALAPHETREVRIAIPAPPRSSEVTPSLIFTDSAGRLWYRAPRGELRHPTDDDRTAHFETHPGSYGTPEDHPTLHIPLTYEEQRGYRVD